MLALADRLLARLPRAAILGLSLLALGGIGLVDYLTGYEISFSLFYLVPVSMATWYGGGRAAGFPFAAASSLVWYTAEMAAGSPYHHVGIPVWNAFVRLSFFVITAVLLSAVRDRLAAERRLAMTDGLTGLLNSRAFTEQLEGHLALAQRLGTSLSLIYVDLDDFKKVNDTYGHGEGDRRLRSVGRALLAGTRRTDVVARLGGDEFALVLPDTDVAGTEFVTEKIERLLRDATTSDGAPLTCSIGAVVFHEPPRNADLAIAAADRLMYDAKARGKAGSVLRVYPEATPARSSQPAQAPQLATR